MRAQSMGDSSSLDFMRSRKVFEINPEHEIIKGLNVSSQPAFGYLTSRYSGYNRTALMNCSQIWPLEVTSYLDDYDFVYLL
jgi:hypothetical protein